ncbi:hypothetical protein ACETK8_03480 [Brevundimonas staleyi]|uniref:Uncharacterized protein n=1 Tax=Brevundimonas staleyi TaxID=74326 RepID=A0ABW0FUA7_9CAUL
MIDPVGMELLNGIQASVGWALLAARAARSEALDAAVANASEAATAPLRFRATITIDIDARDLEDAERQSDAVRGQFEMMKRDHPSAALLFQRRKPRTGRRAPAPAVVVAPYVDD